jgi:hypothetical protein
MIFVIISASWDFVGQYLFDSDCIVVDLFADLMKTDINMLCSLVDLRVVG